MAIDSITGTSSSAPIKYDVPSSSDYYIYDENGKYIGFDYDKYTADKKAVEQKAEEENKASMEDKKSDSFEMTTEEKRDADIAVIQGQYASDKIDKEYKDAFLKYADIITGSKDSEQAQIASEWETLRTEANKLTSATASNTTVLEGVKEFISSLTELQNITKHYKSQKEAKADKETIASLKTQRDILDENNEIQVYETNFFHSAVNVYDAEDDAVSVGE